MHRTDTTARKWNASRPTYDEDWSDEEDYRVDEAPQKVPARTVRPPWEPASDENLASTAAAAAEGEVRPRTAVSLVDSVTTSRPAVELQDRPTTAPSHATETHKPSTSQDRRPDMHADVLEATEVSHAPHKTAETRHVEPPAALAADVRPPNSHEARNVDTTRRVIPDDLDAPSVHTSRQPIRLDSGNVELDSLDEQMRLEALMFNPDNLPHDQPVFDEQESRQTNSTETHESDATTSREETKRNTPEVSTREASHPPVPSYPQDFADGLKSRALSDTMIQTTQSSPRSDRDRANSSEDLTLHTAAVTAERTPSILLTTNAWAEKNRALKEQLEKAKREKAAEEARPKIRASTYDHEYDYAPPILPPADVSNEPVRQRQIVRPSDMRDVPVHAQPEYDHTQSTPIIPNLNTLLEEDEEEEVTASDRANRASENKVRTVDEKPSASALPVIENSKPLPVINSSETGDLRAADTHKDLPAIVPSSAEDVPRRDHGSDSGSDGSDHDVDEEDNTVSADQEYAMIQKSQASEQASDAVPLSTIRNNNNKDLPPILQVGVSSKVSEESRSQNRTSLPAIQTTRSSNVPAQHEEYTPSLYSAVPTDDTSTAKSAMGPPESQSPIPQVSEDRLRARPESKSWEPLRATPRNSVTSETIPPINTSRFSDSTTTNTPPNQELSRFSTSTIQTVPEGEQDDYRFDMRDSFNPAMLGALHDNPYSDDDAESNTDAANVGIQVTAADDDVDDDDDPARPYMHPDQSISQRNLRPSASMATLQPPLRHMQSFDSHLSDSTHIAHPTESERLANELLHQLTPTDGEVRADSRAPDTRNVNHEDHDETLPVSSMPPAQPFSTIKMVEATDEPEMSTTSQPERTAMDAGTDSKPQAARNRSGSSASMFLEVMSPMTSMEQERFHPTADYQNMALQSNMLMQYKDIKQLPTAAERTAEYTRRTKALQESSNGLREYLIGIQARLKEQGRDLPAPVAHVEYKASKSIIPDKLMPHDLGRTTARLGDRSKDAAKGLLSKSSKGFKGLFHSNSRSVSSGSQKKDISSPLESNGFNRTPSMIPSFPNRGTSGRNVSSQSSPGTFSGPPVASSTQRINESNPSKSSQSPTNQYQAAATSQSGKRGSMHSPLRDHKLSPSPQFAAPPPVPTNATISHIQTFFPSVSTAEIESALRACEGDEQRAIGYLVVNQVR